MVIGNGVMAKAFYEDFSLSDEVLIFASGVSNSRTTEKYNFDRERNLLIAAAEQNPDKLAVYFSTCSIYDSAEKNSPYVCHKLNMEKIVQTCFRKYIICRVSNVVGKTLNTTTIFNFLFSHISQQIPFKLWKNAYRNVIDVEDVAKIVTCCVHDPDYHNQIINVANQKSYSVIELVTEMERYLNEKAIYTLVDAGAFFGIDVDQTNALFAKTNVDFSGNYIQRLLNKYYSNRYID